MQYIFEEMKKIEKKIKKGVDKWRIAWYYSPALERDNKNLKRSEKTSKKVLKKA